VHGAERAAVDGLAPLGKLREAGSAPRALSEAGFGPRLGRHWDTPRKALGHASEGIVTRLLAPCLLLAVGHDSKRQKATTHKPLSNRQCATTYKPLTSYMRISHVALTRPRAARAINGRRTRAAAGHVPLIRFASRGHSATGGRALLPALPEACCSMPLTGVMLLYPLDWCNAALSS
jgi:hypothetical protein